MAEIPISLISTGSATSDDVTATKNDVLEGVTAITSDSDDEPVEGTIPIKSAENYGTSSSDQEIAAGQYLGGVQRIKGVTTVNIDADNIRNGVIVRVGDAYSAGRIKDVTGTYSKVSNDKTAAGAAQILSGYAAYANGSNQINGTISSKAAQTYTPTTSNQTIAAGQYLSGAQTIKGDSNLVAGNILYGKSIFGVSGNVRKYADNSAYRTSSSGTKWYTGNTNKSCYYISINLGFTPRVWTAVRGGNTAYYSFETNYAQTLVYQNHAYFASVNSNPRTTSNLEIPVSEASTGYNTIVTGYY